MNLAPQLQVLETVGLVELLHAHPELEYLFRHALVRDAAYESLLFSTRQEMHLAVGTALEQMYPERLTEIAPMLAQHFAAAENDEKALHYFALAGDTAVASHANQEAVSHYQQALAIAHNLQVESEALCQLYLKYGRAYELLSQFDMAMVVYKKMEQAAGASGDQIFKIHALMAQAILFIIFTPLYNPTYGEKLVHEAIALALALGDQAIEVAIGRALVQLYRYTGRISQAIHTAEHMLTLARQLHLADQVAFFLYDLGLCYLLDGRFPQSITSIQEAISQWRNLDNPTMLADSLASASIILTFSGQYDDALNFADEALQMSQKTKNVWGQSYAQQAIGLIPWERGLITEAITTMQTSIELSKSARLSIPQVLTQADLAAVYGSLGAVAKGLATAQKAVAVAFEELPTLRAFQCYALTHLANLQVQASEYIVAEATLQKASEAREEDGRFFTLFVQISQSHLALAQGNYQQAITLTQTALDKAQQFGTRTYTPLLLLRQAQALESSGERVLAYKQLQAAKEAATDLGSKRLLWPILAHMSQLENNPARATKWREQAQTIVHFIAEHTPPELCKTFLRLPQVQAVLTANGR